MSISEDLGAIKSRALEAIASAGDLRALDEVRVAVLGKKGELTAVLRGMGQLPAEERPQVGKLANEVRAEVEAALEERKAALSASPPSPSTSRCRGGCARWGTATSSPRSSRRWRTSSQASATV